MYLKVVIVVVFIFHKTRSGDAEKQLTDLDTYTKEELLILPELRGRVSDVLTQLYMFQNKYLVRFLRARNLNVEATEKMLRECFRWRKQYDVDSIVHRDFSKAVRRVPFHFTSDYHGRPGIVSGIKGLDVRQYILTGNFDKLRNYILYGIERATWNIHLASNQTGKEIIRGYLLFNMAGFNARSHACIRCLTGWIELVESYENYYPQLAHKIIVINTPRIFQSFFTVVKPLVSGHTFSALHFYSVDRSEWAPILLKSFAKERLPLEFGGSQNLPTLYSLTQEQISNQLGNTSKPEVATAVQKVDSRQNKLKRFEVLKLEMKRNYLNNCTSGTTNEDN